MFPSEKGPTVKSAINSLKFPFYTAHMKPDRCLYNTFSEEALSDAHGIVQVSLLLLLSISRLQRVVISVTTLHPPPGIPLSPHTHNLSRARTTHLRRTKRLLYGRQKHSNRVWEALTAPLSWRTRTTENQKWEHKHFYRHAALGSIWSHVKTCRPPAYRWETKVKG